MDRLLAMLPLVFYLGLLVGVANLLAQRIMPTTIGASWGKRYGYNVIVGAFTVGLIILHLPLVLLAQAFGICCR